MNSNLSSISSHDIVRSILELLPPVDRDIFAYKIASVHTNWKSLSFGHLQFDSLVSAQKALDLSDCGLLSFQRASLSVSESLVDIAVGDGQSRKGVRANRPATPVQMTLAFPKAMKWWKKGLQPNMKEIESAQDLVDSLVNAGNMLMIVDFFSPGCGGCKALHPKFL